MKKKLIRTLIVLAVIAALIGGYLIYRSATTERLPQGAVPGGISGALVESENRTGVHLSGETYQIPLRIYVLFEDGGLGVGSWSDDNGCFVLNEPGCAYFVYDGTVYCCVVADEDGVTAANKWRIFDHWTLTDGRPTLDGYDLLALEDVSLSTPISNLSWPQLAIDAAAAYAQQYGAA